MAIMLIHVRQLKVVRAFAPFAGANSVNGPEKKNILEYYFPRVKLLLPHAGDK